MSRVTTGIRMPSGKDKIMNYVYETLKANDVKASKKFVSSLTEGIFSLIKNDVMKHGSFSYTGFGTFQRRVQKGRSIKIMLPVAKGKIVNVPEKNVVRFKPFADFKKSLN